ncbi:MAG TPA: transcription-repair coupling factor [Acidobacteriota bacterium]|nr:transcription-repair coupling factor [Acidobacteriota bacterium]
MAEAIASSLPSEGGLLEGLRSSAAAFLFASLFEGRRMPQVWVCGNNREAEEAARLLRVFLSEPATVLVMPGVEADPYRELSPHPEIGERRAAALWRLLQGFGGILVTTRSSLLSRLPAPQSFLSRCAHLEAGSFMPRDHLISTLRSMGYVREDPVSEFGEFSFRGGIVDFFSPAHANPVRVEFFGDEVESVREFEPSSQRSTRLAVRCDIVPMREIAVTEAEIRRWHEAAPAYWKEIHFAESLMEKRQFTENGELFNGFEYLFPLVVESDASLFDYLQTAERLLIAPNCQAMLEDAVKYEETLRDRFQDCRLEGILALPPEKLFFSSSWLDSVLKDRRAYRLEELVTDRTAATRIDIRTEKRYGGRIQQLLADMKSWGEQGERVVFAIPSRGMAERVVDIFREYDVTLHWSRDQGFSAALQYPRAVAIGEIGEGFHWPDLRLRLLTEEDVLGEARQRSVPTRRIRTREGADQFLSTFRDLKEGDFVVHVEHGIAKYGGLKKIGVEEDLREFVVLIFRDEARLYVPVDRLDLVQKYSGAGQAAPRIDRLGGASWERTRTRIKKSMRSLAEELLKLYAAREAASGFAFSPDDELMGEFEAGFEYEETPDQRATIADVKRDMESSRPMDRLVCGDVGYGKTEVAMRAAFKAVADNKQVAVLAPTTVLAFQHFNTFQERFRGFPVSIEFVSRFRSSAEIRESIRKASEGRADILIGTHRLLSKDVRFHDLGLIVVDEEQRFGVAHKERLKKLKTEVDVLTLSATPIPRTLNMSLIGIRDLSLIETPPKDRLAIQTAVVKYSKNIVRSAVDLELKRQGQVFFVHNKVETIYSMARMVQELLPEARVAVAHGQMPEADLEKVMLDFLNDQFDVLVCTTIIENGLDIPRANTLIVNRADRFGLSQLYQLRGRVGRSHRRAYAYLLVPAEEILNAEARKRLAAIKEFSDLGSGFRLAAMDLEIRGAGNLLGGEQHGHINAVGFELYLKLLEQTVEELKGGGLPEKVATRMDLKLEIQIPEHYIDDPNLRLWLYKRLTTTPTEEALQSLQDEVVDRFGRCPRSVDNLFEYGRLRLLAQDLKIVSMERKAATVYSRFREDTPVCPSRLIELVQSRPQLGLAPDGTLKIRLQSSQPREVFEAIRTVLHSLQAV